ncbi:glycosyltransferase [Halalkalibacter sp. APA_J-10(15)]|uniref:CgeB family protein n=1 Tax=Halalkalibacter sp. APA_J-10(15) TaxID=2933805 RepID=UPI001FF448D2|nr:glycosyltransferase [Halalkalibacter sp. APA_J-10(15)]MCK0471939.1 glycosyltransferase [Halalkalibacter sp. APA_J-10(15)]
MKIYYVQSGFQQIYAYLDQAIVRSLNELGLSEQIGPYNEAKLVDAIRAESPDFILTLLGSRLQSSTFKVLTRKGIPIAVWLTEDPYYIDETIKQIFKFDYIFTVDSAAKEIYEEAGHSSVFFLPLGADPSVYYPLKRTVQPNFDLMLIGYPYPNRVKLMQKILASLKISCLVVGRNWGQYLSVNKHPLLTIKDQWIPPKTVNQLLPFAAIHLNPHRPIQLKQNKNRFNVQSKSMNNRTFDLASAQQFQLLEHKDDLNNHFRIDTEIISYYEANELFEKISYFLQHSEERDQIARNARKRALSDHTLKHRLKQMITHISHQQSESLSSED